MLKPPLAAVVVRGSLPTEIGAENPSLLAFRLRFPRLRGKVHVATDMAHYEDPK